MSRRAIFLDRDGTLVHARHYPSRPEHLVLYDGIAPGLRTLQQAGFALVVVTNQSGVARGYFTEDDLARLHDHLRRELAALGVTLDGIYHCPHHPDGALPELALRCGCRKPQPGMVLRAAADLGLDPARSWFIGDILDDIEAGNRAGCQSILVDLGTERAPERPFRHPAYVARDTPHALAIIRDVEGIGPAVDRAYLPDAWKTASEPLVAGSTASGGGTHEFPG